MTPNRSKTSTADFKNPNISNNSKTSNPTTYQKTQSDSKCFEVYAKNLIANLTFYCYIFIEFFIELSVKIFFF